MVSLWRLPRSGCQLVAVSLMRMSEFFSGQSQKCNWTGASAKNAAFVFSMAHPLQLAYRTKLLTGIWAVCWQQAQVWSKGPSPPSHFLGLPPITLWCGFSTRGRSAASNGLAHQGVCWVAALPLPLQVTEGEQAASVSQAPSARPPTMLFCRLMSKPISESLFIHKGNKVRETWQTGLQFLLLFISRLLILGIWGNLESITTLQRLALQVFQFTGSRRKSYCENALPLCKE